MRKILNLYPDDNVTKDHHDQYSYIILEIIDDVVKKRMKLHTEYNSKIERVWVSSKPLSRKVKLAKYLMGRLLKESDQIFIRGQMLATKLCPSCNNDDFNKQNFDFFSKTTH